MKKNLKENVNILKQIKMEWNDVITLNGKNYRFESVEEEPLMFIMKIDESYHLQRDINCDAPTEYIRLIYEYKSVRNGVEKDDKLVQQVYRGKEIKSAEFMKELLEHVLYGIIDKIED